MTLTALIAFYNANSGIIASFGLFLLSEFVGNTKLVPEGSVYSLVIRIIKEYLESIKK